MCNIVYFKNDCDEYNENNYNIRVKINPNRSIIYPECQNGELYSGIRP